MARKAREKSQTGMYNVILKGNTPIFKDDEDYDEFISRLDSTEAEVLGLGLISCYAFMCIKESDKGIAADMRTVIIGYARYYNKKYNIKGKLFSDRFKSEPINSEEELKNSISIVQNVTEITGHDGITTDNNTGEYEMIAFYASAMGKKAKQMQLAVKAKPVSLPKTEMKPVKAEVTEAREEIQKTKQNSLPSWLL